MRDAANVMEQQDKNLQKREEALWQHLTPQGLQSLAQHYVRTDLKSEAVRIALQAVAKRREDVSILWTAASILKANTQRFDIVEALEAKILSLDPQNLDVALSHAQTLIMDDKLPMGLDVFTRLLVQFPKDWVAIAVYICNTLMTCGHLQTALDILLSLSKKVDDKEGILSNLIAVAMGALNRSNDALPWHKKALGKDPANQLYTQNYALSLLKSGHFKKGWELWQKRRYNCLSPFKTLLKLPKAQPTTPLKGMRVALYQEQGLGDTLQFIRFLPLLLKRGARVTLCLTQPLERLLAYSFEDVSICSMIDIAGNINHFDYGIAIPDLPYICGVADKRDMPAKGPYLFAHKHSVDAFEKFLPRMRPRIGICWAGGRRPESSTAMVDRRRSMGFEALMDVLTPAQASFVNLQYGKYDEALRDWKGQKIEDPMPRVKDMADTAAIIDSLDLVISVDTSVAHLAGALDHCPVWLISRRDGCWRWGDRGERTVWYPNMRIFRSQELGFANLTVELGKQFHSWVEHYKKRIR